MSVGAKKMLMVTFMLGFFFCLGANIYISFAYRTCMPESSQPDIGRIYPLRVDGKFLRYVTGPELERAEFARNRLFPLGFVFFFGLAALKVYGGYPPDTPRAPKAFVG